ncbi:DUF4416 family protein [Marispirochaeta sp.]|uniref:DUF4416 family protein n=1 Tax=Marispirochaeta sp. TaxID=2038653 RepID=UPI0029C98488|nr:DUF4416 family protein [Marispirochaeta sp.]
MGQEGNFPPEKCIIPLLFSREAVLPSLYAEIERNFGPIDYISREIPFSYSSYYNEEMGPEIRRIFLGLKELIDPGQLWRIKKNTNRIEAAFAASPGKISAKGSGRTVNLDPGLLDLNHLVLGTTKHAGHRIPLSEGIYAEITLHYRHGRFEPLSWTYPDYRSEEYQKILLELREIFHNQLKHHS